MTAEVSRRGLLVATAAAGALSTTQLAAAEAAAPSYGAPLVELSVPAGALDAEQRAAMIQGITEVVLDALKLPPDPARRMFVEIFETAEGGFGVNGKPFVPRRG